MARALAAEQFDVADDFDIGVARQLDHPMRLRMGQRHAGRKNEGGNACPIGLAQVGGRNAGGIGFGDARLGIVIADDIGAAGEQRAGAAQA